MPCLIGANAPKTTSLPPLTDSDLNYIVNRYWRTGLLVERADLLQVARIKLLMNSKYIARARNPKAYARTLVAKAIRGEIKKALDLPETLPEPL